MRFNIIEWFRGVHCASLEKQLRKEYKVDLTEPADFKYPPPSAYEVKQHSTELGLDKPCKIKMYSYKNPQDIVENINRGVV